MNGYGVKGIALWDQNEAPMLYIIFIPVIVNKLVMSSHAVFPVLPIDMNVLSCTTEEKFSEKFQITKNSPGNRFSFKLFR